MRNVGGQSVITLYHAFGTFVNSRISNNNMTGITAIESNIELHGHNVIENNRNTEGAGITMLLPGFMKCLVICEWCV